MATAQPGQQMTDWSSRSRVIRVLVALTVIGVALALVGVLAPKAFGDSGGGDDSAHSTVTQRANDFAVSYNTYDVAQLADYQKRLKGLLTPAYDKQFVAVTKAVFTALTDKRQKSDEAKVLGVAIESIDDDSAEAIVAVDASITNTDNPVAVVRHFRWKISFTKTKSDWLVSNFESIAAVSAETAPAPTAAPSSAPSAAPTATPGGDGQ